MTTPKTIAEAFGVATDAELGAAAYWFIEGPGVNNPKRNLILRIIARASLAVATEGTE